MAAIRKSAFDAIDALLEAGWPPMSSTQRTQKQSLKRTCDEAAMDSHSWAGRPTMKLATPPVPPPLPMPRQKAGPSCNNHTADSVDSGSDVWCCDVRHAACIKPQCDSPEPTHAYMVWVCDQCDWCACEACCVVGAHAPCNHELELVDQDGESVCAIWSDRLCRKLPDGYIEHYMGNPGAERLVRINSPNGQSQHFEGYPGQERIVRYEFPNGTALHYEGLRGVERVVWTVIRI